MARRKKRPKKKKLTMQERFPRSVLNPITGVSDGKLRGMIRSVLRRTWRTSSRRVFLESVRFPNDGSHGKFRFCVKCEHCETVFGQTEKDFMIRKDGSPTKKKKLKYEIDHIAGNPPFLDIERDLGKYAVSLLFGSMRLLCLKCHAKHTLEQIEIRTTRRRNESTK